MHYPYTVKMPELSGLHFDEVSVTLYIHGPYRVGMGLKVTNTSEVSLRPHINLYYI